MDRPVTAAVENPPSPRTEAMFLFDYTMEGGAGLAPPTMAYNQWAPSAAYATPPNGFPDPRLHPTGSNLAVWASPTPTSTQTLLPPPSRSTWNTDLSGNIGSSVSLPIPGPSDSSTAGAQQASGYSAFAAGIQSMPFHEREHKTRGVFPSTAVSTLGGGQGISASSPPEHVVTWFLTCWQAVIVNGPRVFVPQTVYEPHSQGDKERYVSLAKLHPPIIFLAENSPEWGIPIPDLLSRQSVRLVDGDGPAFASCGPSIGIRVQWPGYEPCHKQVQTRDYTSNRRMITKEKLAKVVAKCVNQFMDTMSMQAMKVGSDRRWRIGPLDIRVEDIILNHRDY